MADTERNMKNLNTMAIECHESIVRAASEMELLSELCKIICEAGGYRRAWVGYADGGTTYSLQRMAAAGYEMGVPDFRETFLSTTGTRCSPAVTAMMEKRPVIVNDIISGAVESPWRALALGGGCRASIALPLTLDNRPFGVLTIHAADPGAFGSPVATLLSRLSAEASHRIGVLRGVRKFRGAATQTE
jgi:GAF domain-containing protein